MHKLAARSAAWRQVVLSLLIRVFREVLMAMLGSMNEMGQVSGVGAVAGFRLAQQEAVIAQAATGLPPEAGGFDVCSAQDGANFVFELAAGGQRQELLQRGSQLALGQEAH